MTKLSHNPNKNKFTFYAREHGNENHLLDVQIDIFSNGSPVKTIFTNAKGYAKIELLKKVYTFNASKKGYYIESNKTVDVAKTNTETFTLKKIYDDVLKNYTFKVVDKSGNIIKNSTIIINGVDYTCDDYGVLSIKLPQNKYNFTVKKEGYHEYSKNIDKEEIQVILSQKETQQPETEENNNEQININVNFEEPEEKILDFEEEILKIRPNSTFVFLFGEAAAGKTTLLASIYKYLNDKTPEPNFLNELNKKGQIYWDYIGEYIMNNEFPPGNNPGLYGIADVVLRLKENEKKQHFTFLDFAGEDLKIVYNGKETEIKGSDTERSTQLIDLFLESKTNFKMIFLMLLNPYPEDTENKEKQKQKQRAFTGVFTHKVKNRETGKSSKEKLRRLIGLSYIVTRWDLMKDKNEINYFKNENIIESLKLNFRKSIPSDYFKFSVGDVFYDKSTQKNKIKEFNYNDIKNIIEWLCVVKRRATIL